MNEYYLEIAARERQAALRAEAESAGAESAGAGRRLNQRERGYRRIDARQIHRAFLVLISRSARRVSERLSRAAESIDRVLGPDCCVDPEP